MATDIIAYDKANIGMRQAIEAACSGLDYRLQVAKTPMGLHVILENAVLSTALIVLPNFSRTLASYIFETLNAKDVGDGWFTGELLFTVIRRTSIACAFHRARGNNTKWENRFAFSDYQTFGLHALLLDDTTQKLFQAMVVHLDAEPTDITPTPEPVLEKNP